MRRRALYLVLHWGGMVSICPGGVGGSDNGNEAPAFAFHCVWRGSSAFLAVFHVCFLEGMFVWAFGLVDQGAFFPCEVLLA